MGLARDNVCTLAKASHYDAPVNYIFDLNIYEYDIAKANISILCDFGHIDEKTYQRLYVAPRDEREYTIGMMQRNNPDLTKALNEGLEKARVDFCREMKLTDSQILHINKDAIFCVMPLIRGSNTPNRVQIFERTEFTLRGRFNSYMKFGPVLNVYMDVSLPGDDNIIAKVRGIDNALVWQFEQNGFLYILKNIMSIRAMSGSRAAYQCCKDWVKRLLNIPAHDHGSISFLRRFDAFGLYDVKDVSKWSSFQLDYLSEGMEPYIDPSYNIGLLHLVGNYLMDDMIRSQQG